MSQSISPDTTIAHYRVVSKLGQGGMGEVYRARDAKLGRDVAIKVLPTAFSADAERLRRFEQEAQAAGALNHPNILVIFHVGAHDGAPYIVSELLEGKTLRERIQDGPIPQRKALEYASQIAHGLAAAHAKGIIHRDLKPENLFVTNEGRVKILDFGLAKLVGVTDGNRHETEVPTRRIDTGQGVVVGTVGYISPEQLRGYPADHRSDIFSFGAILYEMLAGRRAFQGESAADTMSAILKEDPPDLLQLNPNVSPALERLVNHCLEKVPEERFHSVHDLAFALEALSGTTTASSQIVPPFTLRDVSRPRRALIIGTVTAALLLGFIATALLYFRRSSAEVSAMRFMIAVPENSITDPFSLAISPDGGRIAFVVISGNKQQVWLRPLSALNAEPLPGTEGARSPFWSPDSRSLGFFAQGKLKRIEATGGPVSTLCDAISSFGGAWNSDGVIIFAPSPLSILYRVDASGGTATPLTKLDPSRRENGHRWPCFLPDGRHFVFSANSGRAEDWGINVGSLDSQQTTRLLNGYVGGTYARPGFLLFTQRDVLFARPFDATTRAFTGEPVTLARQVKFVRLNRGASVSENGVLVYELGRANLDRQLIWFDRKGNRLSTLGPPGEYDNIQLSSDGKQAALDYRDPQASNFDIGLLDAPRGLVTRFTFDPSNDSNALWSPDNSRIAFVSARPEGHELLQKASSGVGNDVLIFKADSPEIRSTDWSRDGRFIIYERSDPKTGYDLWLLPLTEGQKPFPFVQDEFNESQGRFSPDSRWIAYTSNESGTNEVYVRPFPRSTAKWRISINGGEQPRWRRDGKEIFYVTPDRKLMAVNIDARDNLNVGVASELFQTSMGDSTIRRYNYDVSADGQRFLVIVPMAEAPAAPFVAVVNWYVGLKR